MTIQTRKLIIIGGLLLATVALSLVPVLQTALKGKYNGVPPAYVDDDLYYYSRIKEVADDKPFLGNPQFIEYRDASPVAFFVGDWLAAAPLLAHIPFTIAVVLNFVLWSLFFVFLAYVIGRKAAAPPLYAAGAALLAYCEVYWLIFRPVPMQQVFPFFFLFLLAFGAWLRRPLERRTIWFLVAVSAASFYVYTYLWQIIFAVLSVVFLHRVAQKRWQEVRALLTVALGTAFLALPAIVFAALQIGAPFYWETLARIGLVQSHLPTIDVYLYGRWAVLLIVLAVCIQKWLEEKQTSTAYTDPWHPVIIYTGIGLLASSVSNSVTGNDVATAQHIGRFITLCAALFFPILVWRLYENRQAVRELSWLKFVSICMLLLACLGFLGMNLKRALPFQRIASTDVVAIQGYAAPLEWLDKNADTPVVVWANEEISTYVPILTKHYVFWGRSGGLYLMPTGEVEDRFLAASIAKLTADDLVAAYKRFEGIGPFSRYTNAVNANRLRCMLGRECNPNQSIREWIGTEKLHALVLRQSELKKNIAAVMKKYHVAYLVADTTKGEERYFKSLSSAQKVWSNERFIIYEVK